MESEIEIRQPDLVKLKRIVDNNYPAICPDEFQRRLDKPKAVLVDCRAKRLNLKIIIAKNATKGRIQASKHFKGLGLRDVTRVHNLINPCRIKQGHNRANVA